MVYIPQVLGKKRHDELSSNQKFELLLENLPQIISIFIAIQKTKIIQQRGKERLKQVRKKELQLERSSAETSNADRLELKVEREEAEKDLSGNVYYFDGSPVIDDHLTLLVRKHFLFRVLNFMFLLARFGFYITKEISEKVYPIIVQEYERRKQKKYKKEKQNENSELKEDDEEKSGIIIIDSKQISDRLDELSRSLKERKWIQNDFRKELRDKK